MIRAKNYETASKFVKVMPKILWPLFSGHVCAKKYEKRLRVDKVIALKTCAVFWPTVYISLFRPYNVKWTAT